MIDSFAVDENGQYTGEIESQSRYASLHKCNMICIQDVFEGTKKTFKGPNTINKFLTYIESYNKGNVTLIAHNSSRYDTRIIFEHLVETRTIEQRHNKGKIYTGEPQMLARGLNFISLEIPLIHQKRISIRFIDSLNHLPGSLRNLGKAFGSDTNCVKGYFPYIFNTTANWDYQGVIPSLDQFSINPEEEEEFMVWYNERKTRTWNLQEELELYCKQDVAVLANICYKFHTICSEENDGYSPWGHVTGPSYVHACYLREIRKMMELPDPKSDEFHEKMQECAKEYWTILNQRSHMFAQDALRGGRTDTRQFYKKLQAEELARGERISYVDVVSLYPYQQAIHDFPVGNPEITIYDWEETPCKTHSVGAKVCKPGNWCEACTRMKCKFSETPLTADNVLNDSDFFGIINADVICPLDMFHPILPKYDHEQKKCTFPCGQFRGTFTSIEFKRAVEMGYEIVKVYRYDKYLARPSLWADKIKRQYLKKMINSREMPNAEEQQRLLLEYDTKFEMKDLLQETFTKREWQKNSALKQAFKIMVNCAWGKHAERIDKEKCVIMSDDPADANNINALLANIYEDTIKSFSVRELGKGRTMLKYQEDYSKTVAETSRGYIPCAAFVPAYGRLQLWEQLHKLGKRVLYHDTDSIIYHKIPGEYNIPESDIWGEWEREDVDSKNGGIVEFVSSGPKAYGIRCANGFEMVKMKGVSLGTRTKRLFNFNVLKENVLHNIDAAEEEEEDLIDIPQTRFDYECSRGIITLNLFKKIGFQKEHVKGYIGPEYRHYPKNYKE